MRSGSDAGLLIKQHKTTLQAHHAPEKLEKSPANSRSAVRIARFAQAGLLQLVQSVLFPKCATNNGTEARDACIHLHAKRWTTSRATACKRRVSWWWRRKGLERDFSHLLEEHINVSIHDPSDGNRCLKTVPCLQHNPNVTVSHKGTRRPRHAYSQPPIAVVGSHLTTTCQSTKASNL